MEIGDIVLYLGRRYVLRGFTRASSTEQHAVVEDAATGEFVTVPLAQVEPAGGATRRGPVPKHWG
jgi:hypothetical protein